MEFKLISQQRPPPTETEPWFYSFSKSQLSVDCLLAGPLLQCLLPLLCFQTLCFSDTAAFTSTIQSCSRFWAFVESSLCLKCLLTMSSWKCLIWLLKPDTDIPSSTPSDSDLIGLDCGLSFGSFKHSPGETNVHQSLRMTALGSWFFKLEQAPESAGGHVKAQIAGSAPRV